MQVDLKRLAQLVSRARVGNNFNDPPKQFVFAPASAVGDASVWRYVEVKAIPLEYLLKVLDHLKREDVLSQVVVHFEDAADYLHVRLLAFGLFHVDHVLSHALFQLLALWAGEEVFHNSHRVRHLAIQIVFESALPDSFEELLVLFFLMAPFDN
jgi:hypothetical protein